MAVAISTKEERSGSRFTPPTTGATLSLKLPFASLSSISSTSSYLSPFLRSVVIIEDSSIQVVVNTGPVNSSCWFLTYLVHMCLNVGQRIYTQVQGNVKPFSQFQFDWWDALCVKLHYFFGFHLCLTLDIRFVPKTIFPEILSITFLFLLIGSMKNILLLSLLLLFCLDRSHFSQYV